MGCLAVLLLIGAGTIGGLALLVFSTKDDGLTSGFLQERLPQSKRQTSKEDSFASLEEMMRLDGAAPEDLEILAPLDLKKVDERGPGEAPVMRAAIEHETQADQKPPEARLLQHPTRPLRLDVPEGYFASLTIAGAYLFSSDFAVELAWLSSEELRELPTMSKGSHLDDWRVTTSRASSQMLPSGAVATLMEASAMSEDGSVRALIRTDVPIGEGTVVLGAEGKEGEKALLRERVLHVASKIDVTAS